MSLPPLESLSIFDSSPPPPPAPRDRFSALPPELFDHICNIVYHDVYLVQVPQMRARRTHLGRVSRAFLHQERVHRFRKVHISTLSKFHKLHETLVTSPACRTYVEDLTLSFKGPAQLGNPPLNEQLVFFLECLPSLLKLRVKHFPRLTRLLINPPRWSDYLSSLKELDLADHFPDWEDPYNPIHWMNLDYYPHLVSLDLEVCRVTVQGHISESNTYFKPLRKQINPNLSLTSLRLVGWLSLSPSLVELYQHFPNLSTLSIEEPSTENGHVSKALDAFPFPHRIDNLIIKGDSIWSSLLESSLPKYSSLKFLHLDKGAFDPSLVPILRDGFSNLRQLYIQDTIDHGDVKSLFDPKDTLNSLYIGSMRVKEDVKAKIGMSPVSDTYVETILNLVNEASMYRVELDGPAIWDAEETKERKARVAKARAQGTTYEDMDLDVCMLECTERQYEALQRMALG